MKRCCLLCLLGILSSAPLHSVLVDSLVPLNERVSDFDTRWALARIYSHKKATRERALKQYEWLMAQDRSQLDLILEAGQLYISLKRTNEGLQLLEEALVQHPDDPRVVIAVAQAELQLGHAAYARNLFERALELSDDKQKAWLAYADGMMLWGDFYRAEEIFSCLLAEDLSVLDNWLRVGWALMGAQRYEDAEGIFQQTLLKFPDHPKVLKALADLKVQEKDFESALCFANQLTEPDGILLQGNILFELYEYEDAVAAYTSVLDDEDVGAWAYLGLGRSYQELGEYDLAAAAYASALEREPQSGRIAYFQARLWCEEDAFVCALIDTSSSVEVLHQAAEASLQTGSPELGLLLFEAILDLDPFYFPAQIGEAEMLSTLFYYDESLCRYHGMLEEFPCNYRIMLAISRVLGWSKHYNRSIQHYNEMLAMNPLDPLLYREKARTALWGKKYCLAMNTYDSYPCENEDRIQTSLALEKYAKSLSWNRKIMCSIPAYDAVLEVSPGNEEILFDKAQAYAILGLPDQSRCVYEELLHISPSHKIVQMAVERNERNLNFGINNYFTYWRELGSGTFSQSQIARYRFDTVLEQPLDYRTRVRFIQSEYVENPFYNFKFYAAEGQALEAGHTCNERFRFSFSVAYKNYFNRFKPTYTSKNYLFFTLSDRLQMILSCNRVDEIYNYFSLKQRTQSTISSITLNSTLTRYWTLGGTYEYYAYSDHNSQNHVCLITEYQLTEDPNILKLILQGDYRNTAHDSVVIMEGDQVVDVIFPYWTPQEYYSGTLTLQYRHYYRKFEFAEAPDRYFDFKVCGLTDSVDNPSIQGIITWRHDFDTQGGFELKGYINRSKQWNAEGAWASLFYRF